MIAAVEKLCVISLLFVLINNIITKQNLKVYLNRVRVTLNLPVYLSHLKYLGLHKPDPKC